MFIANKLTGVTYGMQVQHAWPHGYVGFMTELTVTVANVESATNRWAGGLAFAVTRAISRCSTVGFLARRKHAGKALDCVRVFYLQEFE